MNLETIALECTKKYIESKYSDVSQHNYEEFVKEFHDKYLQAFDIIKNNSKKNTESNAKVLSKKDFRF